MLCYLDKINKKLLHIFYGLYRSGTLHVDALQSACTCWFVSTVVILDLMQIRTVKKDKRVAPYMHMSGTLTATGVLEVEYLKKLSFGAALRKLYDTIANSLVAEDAQAYQFRRYQTSWIQSNTFSSLKIPLNPRGNPDVCT